jgi:hypothetical protein
VSDDPRPTADEDHFGALTELIGDRHSTVETGRAGVMRQSNPSVTLAVED